MTSSTLAISAPDPRPKPSFEELKRIEQRLLDELVEAQQEYNASKEVCRKLNPIVDDLEVTMDDLDHCLKAAVRAESCSLARYASAIKAFNDFVLRGILPPCD
jgi:hypothetical protein